MIKKLTENKKNLLFLIFLKTTFSYLIYYIYTNFLGLDIFRYPDMEAYKDCIGTGDIMVNIAYSQFLCTMGLNYEEALSGFTLISLAIVVNIFSICFFYILFKDFLSRTGQIILLLSLSFHPYLAIYFARFYTDIFGFLGILLISYYSIKNIKINYYFAGLAVLLINLRASLMPSIFLFATYRLFKEFVMNKKISFIVILLILVIGINFLLYKTFSDTFLLNNNYYLNKFFNIIFLLGFREGAANEGFISIFFNGSISGYIQFFISVLLVIIHSLGIYSFIKFIQKYQLYGLYSTLAIVVVPLLTISHMRYLLPIIPLLMFGACWYFFKKTSVD